MGWEGLAVSIRIRLTNFLWYKEGRMEGWKDGTHGLRILMANDNDKL